MVVTVLYVPSFWTLGNSRFWGAQNLTERLFFEAHNLTRRPSGERMLRSLSSTVVMVHAVCALLTPCVGTTSSTASIAPSGVPTCAFAISFPGIPEQARYMSGRSTPPILSRTVPRFRRCMLLFSAEIGRGEESTDAEAATAR